MLWIAPIFAAEFKYQLTRSQKIQGFKTSRLREEGRSGTIVPVGVDVPAGAELDPAAVEVEERRAREVATGARGELVTSAVDVELFPLNETFRVGEHHDADCEGSETELVGREDLTCPAHRTALVTETELGRNDEDVEVLLLVAELLEHLHRLGVLSQVLRSELAVTVVVELPLRRDHCEHLLDRLTVGRRERLPLRNGEPSLGTVRKRRQVLGELESLARVEIEDLGNRLDLVVDRLRPLVLLRVRVAGTDFLVGVLVGHGQLGDELRDPVLQFATALVEPLCARIVELGLVVDGLEETSCVETFWVSAGDQCL